MNKQQLERIKTLKQKHKKETYKHLRGRHDQRDHAWNRGMGGGGGAAGGATGGLSNMMKYRQTRQSLLDMVRTGEMTRNEASEQLRAMRDTLGSVGPTRREDFAASRGRFDTSRDRPWTTPRLDYTPPTGRRDGQIGQNAAIEIERERERNSEMNNRIAEMTNALPNRAPASGGLAGITQSNILASRAFNFAASQFAQGFEADSTRFRPENQLNATLLRNFPFMQKMVQKAANPSAAQAQYDATVQKMTDSLSGPTNLWDIAKQAYLAERIKGEQKNIEALQSMNVFDIAKGGIARRQAALTKMKNDFYNVSKQADDAIRKTLGPASPGNLGRPFAVQGFSPIDEARVYAAIAKVGAQIDSSVLRTSHGGPLRYRVIAADLGNTRTLAYHDYSDSFIDPISGLPMPMSTIVINSSKLDDQSIESAIAHEMGHALVAQLDANFVNAHTEYLQSRLAGEELKYNEETGELYYEDLFPRYYPGVVMSGGDPRFAGTEFEDTINWGRNQLGIPDYIYPTETLSTGLEEYITDPQGMMLRDPDLFLHLNSLFNGTASAYSASATPSIPGTPPSIPGTPPSIPGTPPSIPGTPPSIPGTPPSMPGTPPSIPGTPPSIPGTTPSMPGTPPSIPGTTPSMPGTTPSMPGTTPASTGRKFPGRTTGGIRTMHTVDASGVFLEDGNADVRTTAVAISPVVVGDGRYGTGRYNWVEHDRTKVVDGVAVRERVRRQGSRQTPYIDSYDTADLPEALRNNPEALARIAYLQRYHDYQLGRVSAFNFRSPLNSDAKLNAAQAAAEMFRIFPDARLLDDIEKLLPNVAETQRMARRFDPAQMQDLQDLKDFVNYWKNPTRVEVVNKGKPNEGTIRTDLPIPENIRKFGIPGQSLSPSVDIFPDNSSNNPSPGKPYRHISNADSVYNTRARGEKLGDESFLSSDIYSQIETILNGEQNRIEHQIPLPKAPKPSERTATPKPDIFSRTSVDASTYLSEDRTPQRVRYTKPKLGMNTISDFTLETNADGSEFPTKRNTPYLDEVDPNILSEDLREIAPAIGKLQRAYDAEAITALTQRDTPEGAQAAINAAEIAAMMFQQFPDVSLLENAESMLNTIEDEASLPSKERARAKQVREFASFWRDPRKDTSAANVPKKIEKFGVPTINIYQDMAVDRNADGKIKGDGKTAIDLTNSEESGLQSYELLNSSLYDKIVEGIDTSSSGKPSKPKRVEAKRPESLLPETSTTPEKPTSDTGTTDGDLAPLPPSSFEPKPRVDGETRTIASNVIGNETVAYGASPDKPYRMRHRVVDIREVIPSTTLNGDPNPAYDSRLQPRDRSRVASRAQVSEIANKFLPSWMINDTNKLDDGSPIIDNEGQVISGNGRTLAMQQLATTSEGRKKLEEYKKELLAKSDEYGLSKEEIEKMEVPVLVREVANDIDKEVLAVEANRPRTSVMPAKDQARSDARMLPDTFLDVFDANTDDTNLDRILNNSKNLRLRQMLIANVPATERTGLVKADGTGLTPAGLNRLKAVMYAKIFDGENSDAIIDAVTENPDDDFKRINLGIAGSLAGIGKVKAGVSDGSRPPEYQKFINDIGTAVTTYSRIREDDALREMPIEDAIRFLMGGDMFSDDASLRSPIDDSSAQILQFLHTNKNQQKTIRDFFNDITEQMLNQDDYRQAQVGGVTPPTYQEIVQIALQRAAERKANAEAARAALAPKPRAEQEDMFADKSFKSNESIDLQINMLMTTLKSFVDYARAADKNTPKFKLLNSFALHNLDTLSALINQKKQTSKSNKMSVTSTGNFNTHKKIMQRDKLTTGGK